MFSEECHPQQTVLGSRPACQDQCAFKSMVVEVLQARTELRCHGEGQRKRTTGTWRKVRSELQNQSLKSVFCIAIRTKAYSACGRPSKAGVVMITQDLSNQTAVTVDIARDARCWRCHNNAAPILASVPLRLKPHGSSCNPGDLRDRCRSPSRGCC